MHQFSGLDYLKIDVANHAGLDKQSWDSRIKWVEDNRNNLKNLVPEDPKTKFLYMKAVHTLNNKVKPTGFVMALDSTNSGVQIMSALGKCRESALTCNLINTGYREDLYGSILQIIKGVSITRQQVKEAIIPMLYGSKAAPKKLFGEGTEELREFNHAVETTVPVLGEISGLLKSCWDSTKKYHEFTMPDGHLVRLPTMVLLQERIEIGKTSFTFQYEDVGVSSDSTSLLANVVHAVDGYVAREMIRRSPFQLAHIHDSFWTHPNNMNAVRQTYVDILVDIAKSDLLANIMSELSGQKVELTFSTPDLYLEIANAEYALS